MSEIFKRNQKIILISAIFVLAIFFVSFIHSCFPYLFSSDLKLIYLFSVLAFIAIILFYGFISVALLLRAKSKDRMPSKFIVIGLSLLISTIVVAPLTYTIHQVLPENLPYGSNMKTFDASLWEMNSATDWNEEGASIREQMLLDVVINVLPEKNKDEIVRLLGPSLETNYFSSLDKDLIYHLGPERAGLITLDSEWLLIWFDQSDKFERYMLVTD